MSGLTRIAGAPISWGVCEVPGWGVRLPARRVLAEMRDIGLTATEYGPEGYLSEPGLLGEYGLTAVGGFVPVVLHETRIDPLSVLGACGEGEVLVLAAATGEDGYDRRPALDTRNWTTLLANLDAIASCAAARGRTAVLHPHVGTVVERPDEVIRVLCGCAIPLCLDTGHLLVGGADLIDLTRRAARQVGHVHLKDVDAALAARVRSGELTYTEAVRRGMYVPLGQGDADIASVVTTLERAGYAGWYVLEQDIVLTGEPAPGEGPVRDLAAGIAFLSGLAR